MPSEKLPDDVSEDEFNNLSSDKSSDADYYHAHLKRKKGIAGASQAKKRPQETQRGALRTGKKGQAVTINSTPPAKSDRWWWIGGFLFGFAVGLALSLTYGWLLDPRPQPVSPADLRAQDKAFYTRLIALTFAHNNNLEQAQARLDTLEYPDIAGSVAALTEQFIEQEADIRDITALVELSGALGQTSSVMAAFIITPTPLPTPTFTPAPTPTPRPTQTPTPEPTDTPTKTPTASVTPRPTRTATGTATPTPTATSTKTATTTSTPTVTSTPTPGPNAPFGLAQSVALCDNAANGGLLRVYVRDRLGTGVPGVQVTIIWSGGKDTFFTGFKPNVDPGYADFQMEPGQRYQIKLNGVETAGETPEVTIDDNSLCPELPADIAPSWQVVFQQGVTG